MCEDQSDALSLTPLIWTEIVQSMRLTLSLSGGKGPAASDLELEFFCLNPLNLQEKDFGHVFPLEAGHTSSLSLKQRVGARTEVKYFLWGWYSLGRAGNVPLEKRKLQGNLRSPSRT